MRKWRSVGMRECEVCSVALLTQCAPAQKKGYNLSIRYR